MTQRLDTSGTSSSFFVLEKGGVRLKNSSGSLSVRSTTDSADAPIICSSVTTTQITDASSNELIKFTSTASAVNEITVKNNTTGNAPEIQATGGDTNLNLKLVPKGTGVIDLTAGAACPVPCTTDITGNKTLALVDNAIKQVVNTASAVVITIPLNATVAFPIKLTDIPVLRVGSGSVTITGATGVTVNGVSAGSVVILTQYQGVVLQKIATDIWVASGNY